MLYGASGRRPAAVRARSWRDDDQWYYINGWRGWIAARWVTPLYDRVRWLAGRGPRCGDVLCYQHDHWRGGRPGAAAAELERHDAAEGAMYGHFPR